MIELLRNEVRERCPELWARGEPAMLQIGGTNWRGGRIHFAALGADGTPSLFARITRNPADEPRLEREHELLRNLAASDAFGRYVCEQVFFARVGGRAVLAERAAPGHAMEAGRSPWSANRFTRELATACDLAVALARASVLDADAEAFERSILAPLTEFWSAAGGERTRLAPLLGDLEAAFGGRMRTVAVHGDFIPKNLLVDGRGGCTVVDWETGEARGAPLLDLVYFITRCAYLGTIAPGRRKTAAVRAFYGSDGAYARTARAALQRYCAALDLPVALMGPVYRLHFLYKAMLKARTTSLDNPITQFWLELFGEHLGERRGPWPALDRKPGSQADGGAAQADTSRAGTAVAS